MAIGHGELMHECGNSKNEIRQRDRRRWKEESREYGQKHSEHEQKKSQRPIKSKPKYNNNKQNMVIFYIIIIIIYHDFLPTPSRGSHVKSGKTHTHTVIKIHPLAHILDS